MGGALISGLIEGYTGQMLKKRDMEHQQEQEDRRNRIDYLRVAISSGQLKPDAMNAAVDELGEITGEGSGGKKGKSSGTDILKRLLGKVTPQQQPVPFEQRVAGEGGSRAPGLGEVPARMQAPSAEVAATTPGGKVDPSKLGFGQVPTRPKPQIYKTPQEQQDEAIAFERRKEEEVTGPAEQRRLDAEAARQKERDDAAAAREAAREKAAQDRDDARQRALDVRLKNQQQFEERIKRMQEDAATNRERMRDAAQFRLSDSKAADALEKQAQAERAKNISETLKLMQQGLTQATGLLKSREAEAQKQPWYQFWKDAPDTASAAEDIENAKAAITFLTDHKTDVIAGKEDMDEITAKTEDIMRNGQPQWSRSQWAAANPGKDVEKASLAAMKAGMKVVP